MTGAFVGPPNLVLLTYVRSGSPATPGWANDEAAEAARQRKAA
jgi:hypothetical protein